MIYTLLVGCRAINAAALAPIDDVAAVWGMGSTETSLVEVCCSKTSTLTECARNSGLTAERWGLFNDWDFDKDSTVIRAKRHTETIRARRAWAATPCTQFAGPQGWNWNKWEPWQRYQYLLRYAKACRLNKRVMEVLLHVLDLGGEIYWEWPRGSQGWSTEEMHWFRRQVELRGRTLFTVKFDGCMLGLRDHKGVLIYKPWRVDTTDEHFSQRFSDLFCLGRTGDQRLLPTCHG